MVVGGQRPRAAPVGIRPGISRRQIVCPPPALLVVLALMGLTVGLIMALAPLLTIWGSTAVVAGGLLIVAWLLISAAARRWNRMTAALSDEEPGP